MIPILIFLILLGCFRSIDEVDPYNLDIYDGRQVNIYMNIWTERNHAPIVGLGVEYAERFQTELAHLLELNKTRILIQQVDLCFDLHIDPTMCQTVYSANPNVTIPRGAQYITESNHRTVILMFSFLVGQPKTATYYAMLLQNGIREPTSYLYDGPITPHATEWCTVQYYSMIMQGPYFYQGPESPEPCTNYEIEIINRCSSNTDKYDCRSYSDCWWNDDCIIPMDITTTSVKNCHPIVECQHQPSPADYTITYYNEDYCPRYAVIYESPEADWGQELAEDIESFFDDPYRSILVFMCFLACVFGIAYYVIIYSENQEYRNYRKKGRKKYHQKPSPPPSTVMSNSSSDSDSSDSEDGPRKRMPGAPRGRPLQHLGRQQLHFQPHHSQQRFSTEPPRYSAVVYRGPPTEANTLSQAQMSGTFIDPRRIRNSRSRSRPPNKI